jgi:hypothetical protein
LVSAVDEAAVVASEVVVAAVSAGVVVTVSTTSASAEAVGDDSDIQSLPNVSAKPTRMMGLAKTAFAGSNLSVSYIDVKPPGAA